MPVLHIQLLLLFTCFVIQYIRRKEYTSGHDTWNYMYLHVWAEDVNIPHTSVLLEQFLTLSLSLSRDFLPQYCIRARQLGSTFTNSTTCNYQWEILTFSCIIDTEGVYMCEVCSKRGLAVYTSLIRSMKVCQRRTYP